MKEVDMMLEGMDVDGVEELRQEVKENSESDYVTQIYDPIEQPPKGFVPEILCIEHIDEANGIMLAKCMSPPPSIPKDHEGIVCTTENPRKLFNELEVDDNFGENTSKKTRQRIQEEFPAIAMANFI